MKTVRSPIRASAALFSLIGITVVVVSLYLAAVLDTRVVALGVIVEALKTIGIALLGFGMFNIVLDTFEWKTYFEQRLRSIVLEQAYISTLSDTILTSLQTNVLKAQFKDPNIDHEGSFFNYFQKNLHRYIAEPYREDVTCEIICTEGADDTFDIYARVTYTCRKGGAQIQQQASWGTDPDEVVDIKSFKLEAQLPSTHPDAGDRRVLEDCEQVGLTDRFDISLKDYADIDGLIIITTAEYSISRQRFQVWDMAHPTRNLDITITYPKKYRLQTKSLVLEPKQVLITQSAGYLKMKFDSWMLPRSGMAWRFILPESLAGPTSRPPATAEIG